MKIKKLNDETRKDLLKVAREVIEGTLKPYRESGVRKSDLGDILNLDFKPEEFCLGKYFHGALYGNWDEATLEKREYVKLHKTFSEGIGAQGGFLVPPVISTQIIENLRAKAVIRNAGATVYPINSDTLQIPGINTSTAGAWRGKSTTKGGTQATFKQLQLVLKEYSGIFEVPNSLIKHSSPALDVILKNDIAETLRLAEDIAYLEGPGGTAPTGIYNWAGIGGTTIGRAPKYDDLIDAETSIESNNGAPTAWVMHPRAKGKLRKLKDGEGMPVWYRENNRSASEKTPDRLLGKDVFYTTQISTVCSAAGLLTGGLYTYIVLADWKDYAIAEDAGTPILVEVSREGGTAWTTNSTSFRATMERDAGPRHPAVFYIMKGVLY